MLIKEIQEVTKQKDKLENTFGRLDQIERDFERALVRIEELETLIKTKNEQIDELKKVQKVDRKTLEGEQFKLKSAMEVLEKSSKQISSLASGQVTRIKLEIAGKFDKTVITKEFEIMATALKQLQESCTPNKIDPKGPSEETFSRQLLEANKKVQKLETDLSTIKSEFREYRVEHDNFKKQAERFEAESNELKDRNSKLQYQFQKQFSDTAEARKQLTQAQQELNALLGKVQQDYDDLSVEY